MRVVILSLAAMLTLSCILASTLVRNALDVMKLHGVEEVSPSHYCVDLSPLIGSLPRLFSRPNLTIWPLSRCTNPSVSSGRNVYTGFISTEKTHFASFLKCLHPTMMKIKAASRTARDYLLIYVAHHIAPFRYPITQTMKTPNPHVDTPTQN
jgi:hypothetical protein